MDTIYEHGWDFQKLLSYGTVVAQTYIYQLHGSARLPQLPGPHSNLVSVDLVRICIDCFLLDNLNIAAL